MLFCVLRIFFLGLLIGLFQLVRGLSTSARSARLVGLFCHGNDDEYLRLLPRLEQVVGLEVGPTASDVAIFNVRNRLRNVIGVLRRRFTIGKVNFTTLFFCLQALLIGLILGFTCSFLRSVLGNGRAYDATMLIGRSYRLTTVLLRGTRRLTSEREFERRRRLAHRATRVEALTNVWTTRRVLSVRGTCGVILVLVAS